MSKKKAGFFCKESESHREHLCSLMELGKRQEVVELTKNPAFVCQNCGVQANHQENLCNPEPLEKETP